MKSTIVALVALAILIGYIKLCQENVKPFSNIGRKWRNTIAVVLFLLLAVAGVNSALSPGLPKQTQEVLLFKVLGSIVIVPIAIGVVFLWQKIQHTKHEEHRKSSNK